MPTVIVTTDVPGNVKPCFASSSNVGLTVRSNGEEDTKVLDTNGNMVNAQFPAPANAPVISVIGGSGSQTETFNDASIGPPIYRDGRTYDGQKTFFSPTSKPFLSTDVGSNIFLN